MEQTIKSPTNDWTAIYTAPEQNNSDTVIAGDITSTTGVICSCNAPLPPLPLPSSLLSQYDYLALIFLLIIFIVGITIGVSKMYREAVRKGKAEYVADKDGSSRWRWIGDE